MAQQIIARWTNPTHHDNGVPYNETDHSGYVVTLDAGPPIKLPLKWGTDFDLGTLPEVQALATGSHVATIAPISNKGVTGKSTSATFLVYPAPASLGNFTITTGT